ncbi:predicted protein [Verticillium alfalfae VaMs.102]|uniref:Predicted protein n=1 Tax=Verticillium alfalfae (strain VaMs.102 / ATCC MYA-4576 / FGSC 10136) TaxID=526221 RepID=C9SSA3_VERA1|nr:predicted protein [Verticillium alfalfae VaMs.102]EEY21668.1 predicted protein [Verticillium alfalfae VaMs.102]
MMFSGSEDLRSLSDESVHSRVDVPVEQQASVHSDDLSASESSEIQSEPTASQTLPAVNDVAAQEPDKPDEEPVAPDAAMVGAELDDWQRAAQYEAMIQAARVLPAIDDAPANAWGQSSSEWC